MAQTKEKSRFARKNSVRENRLTGFNMARWLKYAISLGTRNIISYFVQLGFHQ